jgi:cellulose synthase/poly-beta-1,6-N-acetylglucosamine synthase-like glycosyltransferase
MLYDFNFEQQPLWEIIAGCILIFSLLLNLIYYFVFFRKFAFYKKKSSVTKIHDYKPVSIIIAAKNEYLNLKENLPFLLNQDYPEFEVVVVDDHSQDDTWDLLCAFKINNPNIKIIRLNSSKVTSKGKKFPLSIGIKEAKYQHLLLTDADCRPTGPFWIKKMLEKYHDKTEIVLGYGKYYRRKSLLNYIIRFDTVRIAIQYFSAALSGFPYMGVGRNLSYKRELFINSSGFTNHFDLNSGDDDLFISEHAGKNNTAVCIEPEAFMWSEPKHSFKAWFYQKRRHLTTGSRYRFKHKIFLGLYQLNILLFPILVAILLIFQYQIIMVLSAILLKWISQWIIFSGATKKLKEKKLLLISPVLETIIVVINTLLFLTNLIRKPDTWK